MIPAIWLVELIFFRLFGVLSIYIYICNHVLLTLVFISKNIKLSVEINQLK